MGSSGYLRNSARTWETNNDTCSLERAKSNQRKKQRGNAVKVYNSSPQTAVNPRTWHKVKKQREKNVQENFSVAIKCKDITYGLGSAGC